MTYIFIIHGTDGNPNENWFPWLKNELEKLKCQVFVPKFPTPEGQNLPNWLKVFKKYKKYLNNNTIVIGHSLAYAFLLNVIEKIDKPIRAAFLIAGFTGLLNHPSIDKLINTFSGKDFNSSCCLRK